MNLRVGAVLLEGAVLYTLPGGEEGGLHTFSTQITQKYILGTNEILSLDTILELTEYHYIVRQMRTIKMSSIVKVVLSLLVCILVNVPKSDLSKCTHTRTHAHTQITHITNITPSSSFTVIVT